MIAPTDAALHHVEVDVYIQAEALKPSAEAVGGLLDEGPHRQRDDPSQFNEHRVSV